MIRKKINIQLWIRRILLIILDCICIIFAGYFALATRFEFVLGNIQTEFISAFLKSLPIFVVATLIIFIIFRIYTSLWEYADVEEIYNIIIACIISGICQLGITMIKGVYLPRSYYILVIITSFHCPRKSTN